MINAEALCKYFPSRGGQTIKAVHNVNLNVVDGSFVLLTGSSGSGKTTLLSLLAALCRPTSGRLTVSETRLESSSDFALTRLRRRIGIVFQGYPLLPGLPVWQNISCPLIPFGVGPNERRARAHEALQRVHLPNYAHRFPVELSAGEQQRVALARALISDPRLIIADEPTASLDVDSAACVRDLLLEFHASGVTIVVSTHRSDFANAATAEYQMNEGCLS